MASLANTASCRSAGMDAGKRGTSAEVLAWIEEVWTDMRSD